MNGGTNQYSQKVPISTPMRFVLLLFDLAPREICRVLLCSRDEICWNCCEMDQGLHRWLLDLSTLEVSTSIAS